MVLLLGNAVVRLAPKAVEALTSPLTVLQWVLLVGFVGFMAYAEGYKGFQKAFSPRVIARAAWLRANPRWWLIAVAPAFCMGLVHATRKRLIVSWSITTIVVLLIIGVRMLAQPWRGIIDAGVVVGLSWGLAAIVVYGARAILGRPSAVPPDVPSGS